MRSPPTLILLIEDNPGDVGLIEEALAGVPFGQFELHSVDRLRAGLTRVSSSAERPIDVVLLDLALPDSSGLQTLFEVKRAAPDIPVVVLTSQNDQTLALAALRQGAQDYLVKGKNDGDVIARSILYAIERRRGEAARLHLAEERAARAAAEDAQRRTAFLAEASVLLGGSLEAEHGLSSLAERAVPQFGDCCVVELFGEDRLGLEQLAVAHPDPATVELLRQLWVPESLRPEASSWIAEVRRTRAPLLLTEVPDSWFIAGQRDTEPARLLRVLGPTSALIAPLAIHGGSLGIVLLLSTRLGYRYGPLDLAMAEDLGRRAALAVENARLYHQAQRAIVEARMALQARDDFMSIAAHELRTPLTPLTLQLASVGRLLGGMVLEGASTNLAHKVAQSMRSVNRLTKLTESLLDVSRVTAGVMRLELEEVELEQLVREVAERFSEEQARSGSQITLQARSGIVGVCDRLRMEQVVTNLLSNALKYGAGGPVEVTIAADAAAVTLAVRDHGIGIARGDLPHIFGRFERAGSGRHYGGLGLGLYITRQIVEAHGGSVEAHSDLGAGSVFTVRLPLRPSGGHQPRVEGS